ncbi:MAG: hypothetical protein ACLP52_25235 [Streptosporangiaceae bacterium]
MTRVLTGSMLVLGAALPMAACGSSSGGGSGGSPTLRQEYPKIKAAAESAKSVQMAGHVVQNGEQISLDMAFVRPASASGTVSRAGATFNVVVTPGKDYVKINQSFLQASHLSSSICAKVCGKYLAVPAGQASSFSGLTMTSLVGGIFQHSPNKSESAIKLTATTYQGQPAWTGSQGPYRVYIARAGKPYLLSLTGKNGESVTFSNWNTATVTPPPASQVITAGQL